MDLTGPYPKLTDADSVYAFKEYTETLYAELVKLKTRVDTAPRMIARTMDDTTSTGLSGSGIMCNRVVCDLVAGRTYRARYTVTVIGGANDAITYAFRTSADTDTSANGTLLYDGAQRYFYTAPFANNSKTVTVEVTWVATVTEAKRNVKVILARATGTSAYNIASRVLSVEDLGVLPA